MAKKYSITLDGITRKYNNVIALDDVSFEWEKGILGLIGPNGAGKTTLIKILSTLLRPYSGNALIFEKDVEKEPLEVRKRIGVLLENPVYHPYLEVFSSLCWVGEVRGLSEKEAKNTVLELLEFFELQTAKNMQIGKLSAGMRQKYGFIHAILGNPPLIMLDEPTSNLDPNARQLYESYVKKLAREKNCTFLISSHVLGELDRLCDGFVFIFKGKIAKVVKKEDLSKNVSLVRVRIISQTPQKLLPILIEGGYTVESILGNEFIVKDPKKNTEQNLIQFLVSKNYTENLDIVPIESETEALYHQLNKESKKKE
jgi:ABC-2 type transport system ATP-binding protein